jgi:Fe-S-cluster containining protein
VIPPAEQLVADLADQFGRPDVSADVAALLAQADQAAARFDPACRACGQCCRFGQFGHVLYLTSAELVHVVGSLKSDPAYQPAIARAAEAIEHMLTAEFCPFQQNERCTLRTIRPLGCRLFFCQAGNEIWGCQLLETFHKQLKSICEMRCLPYGYVEWTTAVKHFLPLVR